MITKETLPEEGFEKVDFSSVDDGYTDEPAAPPEWGGDVAPVVVEPTGGEEPPKEEEAPKVEGVVDTPPPIVEDTKFDISFFNKAFGTEFDSEDSLKVAIQNSSKAKELEAQLAEYESLKSDVEYYKNGINPLDYFASEDDFRVQQFKKQNPDKDANVAIKAFTSDLSKADDLDVLVMYEMLNDSKLKGGEAGAKEIVADQYGIDLDDRDSWTTLQENKLRKAANLARSEISEMKGKIELPKSVNLQSQREETMRLETEKKEQLKTKWTATVDNMFSHMEKVPIYDVDAEGKKTELFNYVVDDKSKAVLKDEVTNLLVGLGKDITEDNIKEAGQYVYERFALANMAKMFKAYGNDLLARQEQKIDAEIHNAEKPVLDIKPTTEADKERAAFEAYLSKTTQGFKRKPVL